MELREPQVDASFLNRLATDTAIPLAEAGARLVGEIKIRRHGLAG